MTTKIVPEQIIPAHKIAACQHCPHFKWWGTSANADCKKAEREIVMDKESMFPSFCPLEDATQSTGT